MIRQTHLHLPYGRYGFLYRFPKRGDGLPMHSHTDPALEHDILCTLGRVAVYGPGKSDYKELAAGEELLFDSRHPHEIAALQDGSAILTTMAARPAAWDKLPPEELDYEFQPRPLDHP